MCITIGISIKVILDNLYNFHVVQNLHNLAVWTINNPRIHSYHSKLLKF